MQVYAGTVNINMGIGMTIHSVTTASSAALVPGLRLLVYATIQARPVTYVGGGLSMLLNPRIVAQASVDIGSS